MKPTVTDLVAQALSGKGEFGDAIQRTAAGGTFIQYDSISFTLQGTRVILGYAWKGKTVTQWEETLLGIQDGVTITLDGLEGRMKITFS